jgi:radical SAM-linked protein
MKKQPPMQSSTAEPKVRIRLTYSTGGAIRYSGNLDLHRIWERAFRRARLPISYSHGFHPQPRLQLASALPLGIIGRSELADLWLDEEISGNQIRDRLNLSLPDGIRVISAEQVDMKEKPLQTRMRSADYQVTLEPTSSCNILNQAVSELLTQKEIIRERRGKIYNLRPLILNLVSGPTTEDAPQIPSLIMTLESREGATGRPEEVLSAMGFDPQSARIERTALTYE